MAPVNPIPDGYPRITAYLCVDGAEAAIAFYREVLGMTERMRLEGPDGQLGHAELMLGDSIVMLSDEWPDMGYVGPGSLGGTPVTMHVYVEDVDAVFARALTKGATSLTEVKDQFYGDRTGTFVDPWGHRWNVATHVEDVPPDEMQRRAEAAMAG